jgi:hypothetical protein
MDFEQTTEIAISGHSKTWHLAASLGYEGALTLGALKMKFVLYQRTVEAMELGKRFSYERNTHMVNLTNVLKY